MKLCCDSLCNMQSCTSLYKCVFIILKDVLYCLLKYTGDELSFNPLMPDPRNNRNFEMIFGTSTNLMTVNKIPKKKLTYPPWGGCEGHVL